MEEAARADRVVVIKDGEIVLDGTPREVFTRTELLHAVGLEAPQGTELVSLLSDIGYGVESDGLDEDECIEALFSFIKRKKENE